MSASTLSADPGGFAKRLASMRSAASSRWWALVAVSLAAFMTYLDNNIVNVAIPTIQRSLHLSVSGLEWVVSSYLLTLAALLTTHSSPETDRCRLRWMVGIATLTMLLSR